MCFATWPREAGIEYKQWCSVKYSKHLAGQHLGRSTPGDDRCACKGSRNRSSNHDLHFSQRFELLDTDKTKYLSWATTSWLATAELDEDDEEEEAGSPASWKPDLLDPKPCIKPNLHVVTVVGTCLP